MCSELRVIRLYALAVLAPLFAACGGSGDTDVLEQAVAVGRYDTVELQVRSQDDKTLFEPGERWQFLAISIDSRGGEQTVDDDAVQWRSSAPELASVNGKGVVEIRADAGDGSFDVIASLGEYRASLDVSVSTAELVDITLSPDADPLPECQSTSFSALGSYSDGSERPLKDDLTWSTDSDALASFDGNLLRSHDSGLVEARVLAGNGTAGSYALTLTDTLTAIALEPAQPQRLFVNDALELTALGSYSGASSPVPITRNGRWASADNTVVTVDEEGVVTAEALGSTTVTVTCGGLDASQEVAVVKVAGIRIVDPLAGGLLLEGEVRQLELYRRFSDGELDDEDIAGQASWSITAGSSIANIDDSGQLTMASSFIGYGADAIRVRAQFNGDEVEVELPIR